MKPFVNVPIGGVIQRKPSVQCARTYRSFIRKWLRPRWSGYLITDFLRPQLASEVEEWLSSLWVSPTNPGGLAPKTVRGIWSQLGRIFHRARKWGYLDRNPIEMVDLPAGSTKRRTKPRSLTPGRYLALLSLYGPLERAAIAISGWLGTRRSEAFGLQWHDFDFQARTVRFERGIVHGRITPLKNEASRSSVSVPEEVLEALIEWRAATPYSATTDWVFASPATRGLRPYWPGQLLKTHIKPIAAAAGFGNIGWHTFRHSFSSWGKEALKLEETKELLRHENLSTTSELYGGLSLEAKRQASERLVEYVKQAAQAESMQMKKLTPVSKSLQ